MREVEHRGLRDEFACPSCGVAVRKSEYFYDIYLGTVLAHWEQQCALTPARRRAFSVIVRANGGYELDFSPDIESAQFQKLCSGQAQIDRLLYKIYRLVLLFRDDFLARHAALLANAPASVLLVRRSDVLQDFYFSFDHYLSFGKKFGDVRLAFAKSANLAPHPEQNLYQSSSQPHLLLHYLSAVNQSRRTEVLPYRFQNANDNGTWLALDHAHTSLCLDQANLNAWVTAGLDPADRAQSYAKTYIIDLKNPHNATALSTEGPALRYARSSHSSLFLNGHVYVVGGVCRRTGENAHLVAPIERIQVDSLRVEELMPLSTPRRWPGLVQLSQHRVLIHGGSGLQNE